MAKLNDDIANIDETSLVGKLYTQLYEGMVNAGKEEFPDTSGFVTENGTVVDVDGINKVVNDYSDILMKNSAYNTAKSIVDTVNESSESLIALIYLYRRTSAGITDDMAIQGALHGAVPAKGNMVVIIDYNETSTIEYGRTGFVFDGGSWEPLSGRIDAKNVIMRGNITLAGNYTCVGNINKGSADATTVLETDGMSVMDVLTRIFSMSMEPTVVQPSISSVVAKCNNLNGLTSVEVGTKLFPYWKAVFDVGSYSYSDTGVEIQSCLVTNKSGETIGNALEGASDTQIQIDESGCSVNVQINYSDGSVPLTNMKEPSTQVQGIKAGIATKSANIAAFRKMFWGYTSAESLDSSTIRALSNNRANGGVTFTLDENIHATQIVIAAPKGTRTIAQVIMPLSANADVTSEFVKRDSVKVSGENDFNPIDYDIWVYKPAQMAGVYQITIK